MIQRTCFLILLLSAQNSCLGRVWTDETGKYRVEATLVSTDTEYVHVLLADARKGRIRRERLSSEDQQYVSNLELQRQDNRQTPVTPIAFQQSLPTSSSIRYVYRGCGTSQHLAGAIGTTVYHDRRRFVIAALSFDSEQQNYYIYSLSEHGFEQEKWAFGKSCIPCYGYPVYRFYDRDQDGNLEWTFNYYASRYSGSAP